MLKNRLKEASTWAGFASLMPYCGKVAENPKNPVAWLGVLAGIVAIVTPEKGASGG